MQTPEKHLHRAALSDAYERYGGLVRRRARRMLRNELAAEGPASLWLFCGLGPSERARSAPAGSPVAIAAPEGIHVVNLP